MWIRENLTPETFAQKYVEWALNPEYLMKILPLLFPVLNFFPMSLTFAGFF